MTTAQMHYFLVAAQNMNFTLAAEQLYISQPALSRQITAIEDEIGTKLFNRANNMLSLTEAGQALYHRLNEIYNDYVNMVKNVQEVGSGRRGHLSIGVQEDQYMGNNLVNAIRDVLKYNPDVELSIKRYDNISLFSALRDESIDAGFMLIYEEFNEYGFSTLPMDVSPAKLAVRKELPYAAKESYTYSELDQLLQDIPLVMADLSQYPDPLQKSLLRFPPFDGVLPRASHLNLMSSIGSVALYVSAGFGVTITNKGNLLSNDPNIVLRPIIGVPSIVQGLVWREKNHNPLLDQLLKKIEVNIRGN